MTVSVLTPSTGRIAEIVNCAGEVTTAVKETLIEPSGFVVKDGSCPPPADSSRFLDTTLNLFVSGIFVIVLPDASTG